MMRLFFLLSFCLCSLARASDVEEATATSLLLYAEEMIEEGRFSLASVALEKAAALKPGMEGLDPARARLLERKLLLPRKAPPLSMKDHEEALYRSESLSGWKPFRSKWQAEKDGFTCNTENSDAFIYHAEGKSPDRYVLTFRFVIPAEGRAGVVLGTAKKVKVGAVFDGKGARFFDFKSMESTGPKIGFKLAHGKPHTLRLAVRGEEIELKVDGRPPVAAGFPGLKHARPGFHAHGRCKFIRPVRTPLESDLLVELARKGLKGKGREDALSTLMRAREIDRNNAEVLVLLGETLSALAFEGESARCYGDLLSLPEDRSLRRDRQDAQKSLALAAEAAARLSGIERSLAEGVERTVVEALASGDVVKAKSALQALESAGAGKDRADELKAMIFLEERGSGEQVTLFDGKSLDGWTLAAGEWKIDGEGALSGSDEAGKRAVLEAAKLPAFERFLIHTRQKGTGAYLDQGIRLDTAGGAYDFHLYKAMVGHTALTGKKITVQHGGNPVLFKGMEVLRSSEWYDVDLLVDLNCVTLLLNGKPLFTKVLPETAAAGVKLYVEAGRRGNFSDIAFRPFGGEAAYRAFLAEKGIAYRCIQECEQAEGHAREQPFAYNGRCLAGGLRPEKTVEFRVKTLRIDDAVLSLRYAAPEEEAWITLTVDGVEREVHLPATGSRNDFTYCRAKVGRLDKGWHDIAFEWKQGSLGILLDRFEITAPGDVSGNEIKVFASESVKHFKIRLSPGLDLPGDPETLFSVLEVLREYMVSYYGFEPPTPLYFNLISRDCWADPHKGGYASGGDLYVPDDTTFSNLKVIMHEMSHCFDHGNGYNPPWFGEGKSFPCYDRFVEETGNLYRKYRGNFEFEDKRKGPQSFKQLASGAGNLFPYWGTEKFPYWAKTSDGRDLTHHGYVTSNWFCYELASFLGDRWLHDYFALIRRDIDAGCFFMPRDRTFANSVIADYFARSSGKEVREFFEGKGFVLRDIYVYEALDLDCGEEDGDYLVDSEGAKVVDSPEGEGKIRLVEGGFLRYAFPVNPGAQELNVAITRKGRATCEAEGMMLFRGGMGRRMETKRVKLDDPSLWADARLTIRFDVDEDKALYIDRVELTR